MDGRWAGPLVWTLLAVAGAVAPVRAAVVDPSPADGAAGVETDPELCVGATPGTVTFLGREVGFAAADFTVVAIPDPQSLARSYPDLYRAETEWIAAHGEDRNIAFVTALGDLTDSGDWEADQWRNASDAFAVLESATSPRHPQGIPYGVCVGNHDNGGAARDGADEGATTRLYNGTFGLTRQCGGRCDNDPGRACQARAASRCCSSGMPARTRAVTAGSMRAVAQPMPSEHFATTCPQGSAISEWP
jgi:hypothetical protein